MNLYLFTEDPHGFGYTVNTLLLPELSLSAELVALMVVRRWYTEICISKLTTYADTAILLQHQKIAPIVLWDAVVNMMDWWLVLLVLIIYYIE